MLRRSILLLIPFLFFGCTAQQISQARDILTSGSLSSEDIARGLKEALTLGANRGASELSVEDGYFGDLAYRILLPEEARKVTDKLQGIPGFSNLEEIVVKKINQGAEDAAKTAGPIFVQAIKQMTIQDALGILKGDRNAATSFLQRTTYNQLYNEFSPVIGNSLNKFDAQKVWGDAANAYNNFPLTRDEVNPDLSDHVTRAALDGLFRKVALEEENIRTNIGARSSELLRRVFAAQD